MTPESPPATSTFNPAIHRRRSIRLQGYDYSQAGAYFITICTRNRDGLFGDIVGREMILNDAGKMVLHRYLVLENKFPDIQSDVFVCMPNHVHFIVVNMGEPGWGEHVGANLCVRPSPLRSVVQWFKTMTTNDYIRGVKQQGWQRFDGKLWQRNYYEHIIRNELSLQGIREYIINNPAQWALDRENPDFVYP